MAYIYQWKNMQTLIIQFLLVGTCFQNVYKYNLQYISRVNMLKVREKIYIMHNIIILQNK